MSSEKQPTMEEAEASTCYRCGTALDSEGRVCPHCGRKQHRLCYCGAKIRKSATRCPKCDADWSRVSRRRRPGERLDWRKMVRFCALGAGLALIVSIIAAKLYESLAGRAVAYFGGPGRVEPSPGLVLSYIGKKLATLVGGMGGDLSRLVWALAIIVIGAGGGALYYMWQVEVARRSRRKGGRRRRRSTSS